MSDDDKTVIKVGDKVTWKQAEFTSAIVRERVGYDQWKIQFDTSGPLAGQIMTVGEKSLRKTGLLEEIALEVEPPDPFFRPKNHPDFGKDYGRRPDVPVAKDEDEDED